MPVHIPNINFIFWYEESLKKNSARNSFNQPIVDRHHSVISNCEKKRQEGIQSAYFTRYELDSEIINEANRLKNLTYLELENEIISLITLLREQNFADDKNDLTLKIFDMIQFWGGTPGGGGPYNRPNLTRQNPSEDWINSYKKGIIAASNGKLEAYDLLKNVTHLGLPFGSKHAFYFSKHLGHKSLIIIDLKIAQCFGFLRPNLINHIVIEEIIEVVRDLSIQNNLYPWQIEKALFTFHLNYFENYRLKNNDIRKEDITEVNWLIENLFLH